MSRIKILALFFSCIVASAACKPKEGSIDIKVGNLNPIEVGVLTPGGKFIFMYSGEFECQGVTVKNGILSIEPKNAIGYYWDQDGNRLKAIVFDEVGTFTVYVSDNLESETENSFAITKKYLNSSSKKILKILELARIFLISTC